jgi:AraC-like DNA-binding protein
MDALSEVLRVLRLETGVFLRAEFTAPWCVDSAPGKDDVRQILPAAEHVAIYHLLVEGQCQARLGAGGEAVRLTAGDLLLFPRGESHQLGSDLQLAPVPADQLVQVLPDGQLPRIRFGGGGATTRFYCGYLACDPRLCRPLLGSLPRLLRIPMGDGPATAWLTSMLELGAQESGAARPGAETMVARLSELLFVDAIRRYVESLPEGQDGWLAGLRDAHVGKALALLHARPDHTWSVDELAGAVALSRSSLSERFARLIGEPPMQYLTRWRLALAAEALRTTREPLIRIAERCGYESEAAFNRAFKREFGVPPGAWRRGSSKAAGD